MLKPTPIQTTNSIPAVTAPAQKGHFARFRAWLTDPVAQLCMACDGAMREVPGSGIPKCEHCGGWVGHPLGSAGLRRRR